MGHGNDGAPSEEEEDDGDQGVDSADERSKVSSDCTSNISLQSMYPIVYTTRKNHARLVCFPQHNALI